MFYYIFASIGGPWRLLYLYSTRERCITILYHATKIQWRSTDICTMVKPDSKQVLRIARAIFRVDTHERVSLNIR